MASGSDIILIDSDESDEPLPRQPPPVAPGPMAPFKKPFMQSESDDSGHSEDELHVKRAKRNPPRSGSAGDDSGSAGDSSNASDASASDGPREAAVGGDGSGSESANDGDPAAADVSGSDESGSSGASESDSSGAGPRAGPMVLEEVVPMQISDSDSDSEPALRSVYHTRMYLKSHGPLRFLEKYLPPTASSEDILALIVQLGFSPRNFPPVSDGQNMLNLIKMLNTAMKRVREVRARLASFDTVDHVVEAIAKASKILVITGAGISTSLGIPDFRSSKGFYSRLTNLGLTDPQEVFDLGIFHTDPAIFYSIAHMILPPDNVCAPLHKFIRLLQDKGKLLRNYTQNIDNLEEAAGIDPKYTIQCHGSFAWASCVTCGHRVKGDTLYPQIRSREIPHCPKCGPRRKRFEDNDIFLEESYGVMKPEITFFGEDLPQIFHSNINADIQNCDLVISIGTSLKVSPVADIVDKVPNRVPQVLINKDEIHHCNFDVSLLGYCDDVASYLCSKLGSAWEIDHKDYRKIVGDGNLVEEHMGQKGVYKISNREREQRAAKQPAEPAVEPDLVLLEPVLN